MARNNGKTLKQNRITGIGRAKKECDGGIGKRLKRAYNAPASM
ncbi:hypothetical protein BN129_3114 [Cronobacter sakazakii 701]|nr:hypothetical protein BN129_3114 [Cronobacter sakazakii 701]